MLRSLQRWITPRYNASAWFRLATLIVLVAISWIPAPAAPLVPNPWAGGSLFLLWLVALSGLFTWLVTGHEETPL